MNNGRPPYSDPSQWGQQPAAGQDPAAQFVPGQYPQQAYQQPYAAQPGYGQQYAQSQPYPQTYQPQNHQAQESYQQQTWQPYGQQAPQQPYEQPAYQQPYQQQYQQQAYQQPYQQQGYQQSYPQQPYQQGMQNAAPLQQPQFFPAKGYSGYVTQPGGGEGGGNAISPEVITKVVLFGVLPVLFLLGMLLMEPVLCWIFIAAAAATVAAMWLRELVDSNLRLISSIVCGVLAAFALFVAVSGRPATEQQENLGGGTNAAVNGTPATGMLTWENTPAPATPTPESDPYAEAGAAAERLQSFFWFWHVNNDENMLLLTAPSWRNEQSDPLKALFTIRANRTPADDMEIVSFSGSEADTMRTAKVKVTVSKNITGRSPEVLSFNVVMIKENGEWYVDPRSLASNEVISTTKATNEMPTQPPLHTARPDTVLYYNPDGGSYYHIDNNCGKINARYLPLKGQFLYSQLDETPYKDLENCTYCGAPLRGQ